MAKKATKARKKAPLKAATAAPDNVASDIGAGIHGIARSIDGLSEEFSKAYYIEQVADNLGSLSAALHSVSFALAASVIAQHGSPSDRAKAVEHLKGWFWESEAFKED